MGALCVGGGGHQYCSKAEVRKGQVLPDLPSPHGALGLIMYIYRSIVCQRVRLKIIRLFSVWGFSRWCNCMYPGFVKALE